ncbi:MAG TPA: hypothetical protein VM143_12705 [Acidimicrobiales bacterium]|nr:hypothetical protein [Acidimicrobiales bacterium]
MNSEPAGFNREALVSALESWDLEIDEIRYLPVGAGSHHYRMIDVEGGRWFVTVDELIVKLFGMMGPTYESWLEVDLDAGFDVLDRAFRTALALRRAGLEFVHAPIARADGEVLIRLEDYAVSVFPSSTALWRRRPRVPVSACCLRSDGCTPRRALSRLGSLSTTP